jgi:type IV pilus assembly protein PilW
MKALTCNNGQRGLSLVELLVSLAISLVIVIAASAFFLGSSRTRDTQEAASLLQDNARFATEVITRSIQQAGYQNYIWSTAGAVARREVLPPSDVQPDIRGFNNSAAGSSTNHGEHNENDDRINNSDTLVTRFQGAGNGTAADGSMIDCMGRPLPAPDGLVTRYYSVFEIRRASSTAEPELRCKYATITGSTLGFDAQPIVRGVESLQFTYGVDTDADSIADTWRNAEQVDMGGVSGALCSGATCIQRWQQVRAVRVGMVLRSPTPVAVSTPTGTTTFSPLGLYFSQGISASPDTLTVNNSDGRLRKVVTFTVNVRNTL